MTYTFTTHTLFGSNEPTRKTQRFINKHPNCITSVDKDTGILTGTLVLEDNNVALQLVELLRTYDIMSITIEHRIVR